MWHVLHELGTTFSQSRCVSGRAQHEAPGRQVQSKIGWLVQVWPRCHVAGEAMMLRSETENPVAQGVLLSERTPDMEKVRRCESLCRAVKKPLTDSGACLAAAPQTEWVNELRARAGRG